MFCIFNTYLGSTQSLTTSVFFFFFFPGIKYTFTLERKENAPNYFMFSYLRVWWVRQVSPWQSCSLVHEDLQLLPVVVVEQVEPELAMARHNMASRYNSPPQLVKRRLTHRLGWGPRLDFLLWGWSVVVAAWAELHGNLDMKVEY